MYGIVTTPPITGFARMYNSGIYKLEFPNGAVYIGQSISLDKRYKTHFREMREGIHPNYKIRDLVSVFGLPSYEVLEYCPQHALNHREKYWIEFYDSYTSGLNLTRGGGKKISRSSQCPYKGRAAITKWHRYTQGGKIMLNKTQEAELEALQKNFLYAPNVLKYLVVGTLILIGVVCLLSVGMTLVGMR